MDAIEIYNTLTKMFPSPKCELVFSTPFELLICVILSAQCTDKRVNEVTQKLFLKYSTPKDFASLEQTELEKLIYSCGFYHNKAKNIIMASKQILEKFNGQVPDNLQDLRSLAGVGRKTANVVYATAFGGDAIAVDTHVFRTSNRLGLSKSKDVLTCENDLMKALPKEYWSNFHYLLVLFGRYKCKSQKPSCEDCPFSSFCVHQKQNTKIKKPKK